MEAAKKYRGIDDETVTALTISRAAVLGAGLMGGGIFMDIGLIQNTYIDEGILIIMP